VRKLGNSSVIIDHELVTAEHPETIYARGHAAIVWVDHRSNKSMPLPELLRAHLQAFITAAD
jgi:acyl-CoA thioester hydrolase